MSQRLDAERLIAELHGARVRGEIEAMCRLFKTDGTFKIAGASADKPISIRAEGLAAFRPWLSMMVKIYRISNYALSTLVVEWPQVAAHWRADIHSKVTGVTVSTELIDLLEFDGDKIIAYTEFFVPR